MRRAVLKSRVPREETNSGGGQRDEGEERSALDDDFLAESVHEGAQGPTEERRPRGEEAHVDQDGECTPDIVVAVARQIGAADRAARPGLRPDSSRFPGPAAHAWYQRATRSRSIPSRQARSARALRQKVRRAPPRTYRRGEVSTSSRSNTNRPARFKACTRSRSSIMGAWGTPPLATRCLRPSEDRLVSIGKTKEGQAKTHPPLDPEEIPLRAVEAENRRPLHSHRDPPARFATGPTNLREAECPREGRAPPRRHSPRNPAPAAVPDRAPSGAAGLQRPRPKPGCRHRCRRRRPRSRRRDPRALAMVDSIRRASQSVGITTAIFTGRA